MKVPSLSLLSSTSKDALIVLFGNFLSAVLGFIFIFMIARILGPEEFGIFSTIISLVTLISAVADLGLSQSLIKFASKGSWEEKKSWVQSGLFGTLVFSVILGGLTTLVYNFYLVPLWHHQDKYLLWVFVLITVITVNIFFLALYQTLQRFMTRVVVDVSFSVFRLLIIGIFLVFFSVSVKSSLISVALGYLLALLLAFWVGKSIVTPLSVNLAKIPILLKFGKWLAGTNFLGNIYGRLDILMLAWLTSAFSTGQYSAAARFISIFPLVASSLAAVMAPRFAELTSIHEVKSYLKINVLLTGVVGVGMLVLLVLAEPIILTAYSSSYREAVPIFKSLVIAYIPVILSIPVVNALTYYFHKPQWITTIALVQLGGLVLLNLLFIPKFHENGPALSLFFMNTLGVVIEFGLLAFVMKSHQKL